MSAAGSGSRPGGGRPRGAATGTWWAELDHGEALDHVFDGTLSDEPLHLDALEFACDGRVVLRCVMPRLPPHVPAKWRAAGHDAASFQLDLIGVHRCAALRARRAVRPLRVVRSGGSLVVRAANRFVALHATCDRVVVSRIAGCLLDPDAFAHHFPG